MVEKSRFVGRNHRVQIPAPPYVLQFHLSSHLSLSMVVEVGVTEHQTFIRQMEKTHTKMSLSYSLKFQVSAIVKSV